jgi:hypothetical protein
MKRREKLSWCLAGLFALVAAGGWLAYHGECRAHAGEREQWRASMRLLQSHATRGMMLEAQKAKEQALQQIRKDHKASAGKDNGAR